MAVLFTEDYESGTSGNNVTTGTSTYTTLTASTKFTFSNTYAHNGSLSGKYDITADTHTARWEFTATALVWWRGYLYVPSLPATDAVIAVVYNGTTVVARLKLLTTGQLRVDDATTSAATTSTAVTTGAWVRFAWKVDPATTSGASSQVLRLYQGANLEAAAGTYTEQLSTTAYQAAQTAVSEVRRGLTVSNTITYYVDDDELDSASEPGPTGTGGGGDIIISVPTMTADASWAGGDVVDEFIFTPPTFRASAQFGGEDTAASITPSAGSITILVPPLVAYADIPDPTVDVPFEWQQYPADLMQPRVDIAFQSWAGEPWWTDVSRWVDAREGISITRGRSSETEMADTGGMSLVLDNSDGRFTPGSTGSPYYPNVTLGRPVRVQVVSTAKNWVEDPSFETGVSQWETSSLAWIWTVVPTATWSSAEANTGTYSTLLTWPAATSTTGAGIWLRGLRIGETYTASAYVKVPSGSPDVSLTDLWWTNGTATSTKGSWTRITVTFLARETTMMVALVAGSADAGDVCYVDDVQVELGSSATALDATGATVTDRFNGTVTSWPMSWPGRIAAKSQSRLAASDGLRQLSAQGELRSMLEEEHRLLEPTAYWPMEEDGGSVSSGADSVASPLTVYQTGSGGELEFGSDLLPAAGVTGVKFTPASASAGKYLYATVRPNLRSLATLAMWSEWTVSALFTGSTASRTFIYVPCAVGYLTVGTNASGYLTAEWVVDGTAQWSVNNGEAMSTLTSTEPHHVAVTATDSGSSITIRLYVDGFRETLYAGAAGPLLRPSARMGVVVGGTTTSLWSGTVGQVALWDSVLDDAQVARLSLCRTGWAGDSTGERVNRVADWLLIPTGDRDVGTSLSTLGAQPTKGRTALDVLQDAERGEGGVLAWSRDGRLWHRGRDARFNATIAYDVDSIDLAGAPEFALDDVMLGAAGNDVTVTRPGGAAQRATNDASIAAYGPYRASLDVPLEDDTQCLSAAQWRVNIYGEPSVRCTRFGVDLVTTPGETLRAAFLETDIGTRLRITDLPDATAPSDTLDLFVEGYREDIQVGSWRIDFTTSSAGAWWAWVLEDELLGVLDSTTRAAY